MYSDQNSISRLHRLLSCAVPVLTASCFLYICLLLTFLLRPPAVSFFPSPLNPVPKPLADICLHIFLHLFTLHKVQLDRYRISLLPFSIMQRAVAIAVFIHIFLFTTAMLSVREQLPSNRVNTVDGVFSFSLSASA